LKSEAHASLWQNSTCEQVGATALTGNASADLVIIGGGFTGASAALEAARRGASVILLEAETIGHGGSGRNVGLVNAGLWLPPEEVIRIVGAEDGPRLMEALSDGPRMVFEIIEREGIACEATRNGTLHLAHAPAGAKNLAERHRQGRNIGAPLELLDRAETARRTGSNSFHGALFDPRAGTVQPLAYAQGLARAAREAGAVLHEHAPVSRIARNGDAWVVTASGHEIRAKSLLLATNGYHQGITGGVQPEATPMHFCQFATAPLPEEIRARILPGGEGCWDTALVMSSLRIDQAGRLIIGGVGDSNGPGGGIHAAWARRKMRALYPDLGDMPFESGWSGRIAMTGDHVPKVVAFGPSALAVFGYSGRGISPGTVFGTAAATALLDDQPEALPLTTIPAYSERFTGVKSAYYEFGATATHAIGARI
jgi:glycine/D-amino acid oxidase-like deaminating enzyme